MPGLAGVVNSGIQFDSPNNILKTFETIHSLQGVSFHRRTLLSECCVIANFLTGLINATLDQPASDSTGNTFVFLEGQIFNTEELLGYLNDPQDRSLCGILLALFLKYGTDFIQLVNGEFNIVIYQKSNRRLTIFNDHLSSKPMYYLEQDDGLLFGSEVKSILAVAKISPTIDPVGLLQMFAHRHHVGGRTFIDGLRCLPPASQLEYNEGRLHITRYSLWKLGVPKSTPKIGLLVEEWGDRLKQATVRRLNSKDRIVMSLSAGLDSRAIACAIPRDFRPIAARTRGYPNSLEVIYATEIAKRLDFDHFREDPEVIPLSDILPKIVWRTEGMIPFINGMTMANHAALKRQGDFMSGGWLGDTTSGGLLRSFMFLPTGRRQFINLVYRWYLLNSEDSLRRIFNETFLHENFPNLRDAFFASFDPIEATTNAQAFEIWNLYERQPRMTLSAGPVDSHLFEYVRPFFDKDYLNFTLTLPTRLRYGRLLYQPMIYQLGPEIRDIPNSNTNLKLKSTVRGNLLNLGIALGNEGKTRLLKKLNPSFRSKFVRADVGDLPLVIRQDLELRRIIENFVHSNSFDSSIFNGPGILNMLDQHYRGVANYASLLCVLATFAVGLPYFVYNKPIHCPPEAEPISQNDKIKA